MKITILLDGSRGAKYRIVVSQLGSDSGGGMLWEIQQWKERKAGHGWVIHASGTQSSNEVASRVLASWLTTPMPLPRSAS